MNRRSFSKLVAGTMTAGAISGASAAEDRRARKAEPNANPIALPSGGGKGWELVILDAVPPGMTQTSGMAAADIGIAWSRFPIDNRFEHHDGAKTVDLGAGRLAIISHGWQEQTYVHLWERAALPVR